MIVVLHWYNDERDMSSLQLATKTLTAVLGPFPDKETAENWVKKAPICDGWGMSEYEIQEVTPV